MGKWITAGIVVVLAILIAFITCSYLFPDFRVATRDIAIVLLAVLQMISVFLMIALLCAILYVVNRVDKLARTTVVPKVNDLTIKVNEVLDTTKSIAGKVQDTTTTVGSTTSYVAERVVSPVIRVSSLFAGVRAAANTLAHRDDSPEEKQV